MNRILTELLRSYQRKNPPDPIAEAHGFLEYVLQNNYDLSDFSEREMKQVASHFGLDEAETMNLLEDAAMWLT